MDRLPTVAEFSFKNGSGVGFGEAPMGTPDRTGWMRHLTTWHKCDTHHIGVADMICLETKVR